MKFAAALALLLAVSGRPAAAQLATPERLEQLRLLFPAADANNDGQLTEEEARAYYAKLRPAKTGTTTASLAPPPTVADAHYGPHERNVLDFWKAPSDQPTPLVVYIHGGGFVTGDKSGVRKDRTVEQYLAAGVSFAAINYRYRTTVPIQDVLHDCARAIQFLRSQSAEWKIDKTRVAAYGSSAGAGTSLWLAFHDDLADPQNADPVCRESTRLTCAGSISGQFSYDVLRWPEVLGVEAVRLFSESSDAASFYGLKSDEEVRGPIGQKVRADCDMLGLISRDDPPVFLSALMRGGEITDRGQYLHHPKHSQVIYERCRELGIPVLADIPALDLKPAKGGPANLREFLCEQLKVHSPASSTGAH
jgi:hypothetical protein